MIFKTKFRPFEKVKIVALDTPGTVVTIILRGNTLWYTVDYWWNGVAQSAEVRGVELVSIDIDQDSPTVGYTEHWSVFANAIHSATGQSLLPSECEDALSYLEKSGYKFIEVDTIGENQNE